MNEIEKPLFDQRRERHSEMNGKQYAKEFEFYIRNDKNGSLPVMVELPNIIALFLNISDKSLKNARLIFNDKLESNIKYVGVNEYNEGNYYKYGIENNSCLVFDLLEETFISAVFAYSAVEATINNLIPNGFALIKIDRGRKVIDDKEYIEKYYKLSTKIKEIIPKVYGLKIDFDKLDFWEPFKKLEYFRNEIVHYKSEEMLGNESNQIGFLTDFIINLLKRDIIESARKLITFLTQNIKFLPGLPHEFCSEPININVLQNYYSKKNFMENLSDFIKQNISDSNFNNNNDNIQK